MFRGKRNENISFFFFYLKIDIVLKTELIGAILTNIELVVVRSASLWLENEFILIVNSFNNSSIIYVLVL